MYATKYVLQAEQNCLAQMPSVLDVRQELADAVYSENLHALSLVHSIHSSGRGKAKLSCDARDFRGHLVDGPKD